MAEATFFWPLKKGIPSEKELAHIADNIQQDWKRLGAALGLKEKHLKAIEVNNSNDVYERALAVLQKWKKKMGRKATYQKLAAAFNDQLVQRPGLVKSFSSDNADNNIWLIKKGTPTDQELQRLAEEIPEDWKRIGRAVGLKEKHLKIIEIDNPDDVCERAYATLCKWVEKQGTDATYRKLARALDDELVQRRDLVEKFCCDIYPELTDVLSRRDTIIQEEDGIRDRAESTRILPEPQEEPTNTEPQLEEIKQEETSSFQETLQTWKRRESARVTKGKTPSFRLRQSKVQSANCQVDDSALGHEIQQIKNTVEAAMQRMNEILEHVHEPSNTAGETSVTSTKEEIVTTDSEIHEEKETFYEAESSLSALQNECLEQTKQEYKRHIEEASASGFSKPLGFKVNIALEQGLY
ncbi:hypothetical protein ACROYT_G016676 [Oculina patagonica]